jgi:hypothetical protein
MITAWTRHVYGRTELVAQSFAYILWEDNIVGQIWSTLAAACPDRFALERHAKQRQATDERKSKPVTLYELRPLLHSITDLEA